MNKPIVIANCVVRNEEKWVWYALNSVVDFVSQILVWDTGSVDNTVSVIKTISHPNLNFKTVGLTSDETALSSVRQEMLSASSGNWLMILDGDEVWPQASLRQILTFIEEQGDHYDSIVVPTLNCVGDVYHISPPSAGKYTIANRTGHYNLRFINLKRVEGLHISNPPGQLQSYCDKNEIPIQNRDANRIAFLNAPYFHLTHLQRTSNRKHETAVYWRGVKRKYEFGIRLPKLFSYPAAFYFIPPIGVSSPWKHRTVKYLFISAIITPLRILKRLLYA